jgi:hypothetical protein
MTSRSDLFKLTPKERRDYGAAKARDAAFDAVHELWRRRQDEGWKQARICEALERNPAWVSRTLRGPNNWTLKTVGQLVEALDGEISITVAALEDRVENRGNIVTLSGKTRKLTKIDTSEKNLIKSIAHQFGIDGDESLSKSFLDGFNAGMRVSERQAKIFADQKRAQPSEKNSS